MRDRIAFEVRSGKDMKDMEDYVERVPRQHSGWQSVTYMGQRYQLFGGIRTDYWINLTMPIKGRQ